MTPIKNLRADCLIWHMMSFDLHTVLPHIRSHLEHAGGKTSDSAEEIEIAGLITADSIHRSGSQHVSPLGIPRVSAGRQRFYSEVIHTLERQYMSAGLQLIRTHASLVEYLQKLDAAELPSLLCIPSPKGSEERDDLTRIRAETSRLAQPPEILILPPNTLIDPDELPFYIRDMPGTFSAFRRRIEKRSYDEYRFAQGSAPDLHMDGPAADRLKFFLFESDAISRYKETRNGLGPGNYSSRLSKWLAVDALHAHDVGRSIREYEQQRVANESTYWLIFELLWRDFYYYLFRSVGDLMFTPRGFKMIQSPGLQESWRSDKDIWHRFRSWVRGTTGQDFIDAIMRELYATAESSNRARQCAASYLIHDLNCPWWWGAWWFEYLLLDYHPLSNWGNWAYIAGVGADSRPVRHFNIPKQAAAYDPQGSYRKWVAEQGWNVPGDVVPRTAPDSAMAQG
ncbi:FAD-binding domain-containing protein [Salinispira pacifica]|nr:FAD-binding domain-containing protein [Salinispira pacifica]